MTLVLADLLQVTSPTPIFCLTMKVMISAERSLCGQWDKGRQEQVLSAILPRCGSHLAPLTTQKHLSRP